MMSPTAIHPLKIVAAVGAAFLLWGLVLAYASSPAWAATYTVDRSDDPDLTTTPTADDCTAAANDCSLRGAITAANANAGDDTIDIQTTGTVNLTGALPDLSTNIEIKGPGADQFTVRRSDTAATNFRIFTVTQSISSAQQVVVSISGITIANGGNRFGGGILILGPTPAVPAPEVTITSSTISGNTATDGQGGGIHNSGTLTITNSTISGNSADDSGGGIFNQGGTLTVSNSTISGNSATNFSGGIFNGLGGTLTVNDSTISGNSANDSGGGIFNQSGTLEVNNSTFSGNSADFAGGGIFSNLGTLEVNNSTFSGNSANDSGGGIFNNNVATLKNTIVANSTGGDCSGNNPTPDSAYNLIEDGSCGVSAANNSLSGDPLLDPAGLKDNGGPTDTIALCSGVGTPANCTGPSDAIDAIPFTNGSTPGCGDTEITTDQRGVSRPQGAACDIGAYEVEVEVDTTAPFVTETSPEAKEPPPTVSKTANVTAKFSEPVQNVSTDTFILERRIAVKKGDPPKFEPVLASLDPADGEVGEGELATLNPAQDLPKGDYRATITTEVTDLADPANPLDQNADQEGLQPKVWTFKVAK